MTVVFPLRYKRETLQWRCNCQASPAFELDSAVALVSPLRLVSGQPATSPFLLLLRPLPEQAVRRLRRHPREEAQKKTDRRTPTFIADMAQFVEMLKSLRWTLVAMYLCIVGRVSLLLVFHVHIHRPLPHELS
jgi:hypothetical protein